MTIRLSRFAWLFVAALATGLARRVDVAGAHAHPDLLSRRSDCRGSRDPGRLQGEELGHQRPVRLHREHVHSSPAIARRGGRSTSTPSDEVPDSSWFTNRIGVRGRCPSRTRSARAPTRPAGRPRARGRSISGKSDGITPGFTIRDSAGIIWFIKFDPPSNPEMATGAEMVVHQALLGARLPRAREPPGHAPPRQRSRSIPRPPFGTFEGSGERSPRATSIGCSTQGARNDDGTYPGDCEQGAGRGGRSARSAISARGPTIPTTSTRTSTAASCAACACSRRG